jgi:hypothetical protein
MSVAAGLKSGQSDQESNKRFTAERSENAEKENFK